MDVLTFFVIHVLAYIVLLTPLAQTRYRKCHLSVSVGHGCAYVKSPSSQKIYSGKNIKNAVPVKRKFIERKRKKIKTIALLSVNKAEREVLAANLRLSRTKFSSIVFR